jgi:hypothetical protein
MRARCGSLALGLIALACVSRRTDRAGRPAAPNSCSTFEPASREGAAFRNHLEQEPVKWAKVIQASGARAD